MLLNLPCSQMTQFYAALLDKLGVSAKLAVKPGVFSVSDAGVEITGANAVLFYLLRKADKLPSDEKRMAVITQFSHAISELYMLCVDVERELNKTAKFTEQMTEAIYSKMSEIDDFLADKTTIQGLDSAVDFYFSGRLRHFAAQYPGDFSNIKRYVQTHSFVQAKAAQYTIGINCKCMQSVFAKVFEFLGVDFKEEQASTFWLKDGEFQVSGPIAVLFYLMRKADYLPYSEKALASIDQACNMALNCVYLSKALMQAVATSQSAKYQMELMETLKGNVSAFNAFLAQSTLIGTRKSAADVFCAEILRDIATNCYKTEEAQADIPAILRYCNHVLDTEKSSV